MADDILGMIVSMYTREDERLAYVIPVEVLWKAWPPLARPYKGLFAFEEEDAGFFFGRETFIDQLGVHSGKVVPLRRESGGGWEAGEAAMGALVVVVGEPDRQLEASA
jgi:hypothetical protein